MESFLALLQKNLKPDDFALASSDVDGLGSTYQARCEAARDLLIDRGCSAAVSAP
jgi:hypothetical protein